MVFDPGVLFETTARYRPTYSSDEAELDAVRSRRKAMSMFAWSREDLKTRDFEWLTDQAFERDLTVILDPDHCFVLHPDQAWRVSALHALWQAAREHGRWTDTAESQMGALLGYSAAQRKRWLADHRWRQPAWGCSTVYALVTSRSRAITEGMTLFAHARGHVMKRDAARLAPAGVAIARVGLEPRFAAKVLRTRRKHVVSGTVTTRLGRMIDAALRSGVELLGSTGWR